MLTFLKACEAMERHQNRSILMDSGVESTGMRVVRSGMGFGEDGTFWDDFMSLCNDPESMADLLNVRKDQVASWVPKIQEALSKIKQADIGEKSPEEDQAMIPTGDNGALTTNNMRTVGMMGDI